MRDGQFKVLLAATIWGEDLINSTVDISERMLKIENLIQKATGYQYDLDPNTKLQHGDEVSENGGPFRPVLDHHLFYCVGDKIGVVRRKL